MKNIFLMGVLVIALAMAGCGEKGTSEGGGEKTAAVEKSEGEPSAGEKNSLSFTSEKISGDGFTLSHVEAVKHKMQTSGKIYSAMIIQLANYDRGGKSWHPNPTEDGQRRVSINFSTPAGEELKVGPYDIDGGMAKDYSLSIGIEGKADGKVESIGLYNGEGTGEITYIDDQKVSGKIDLKDSKGTKVKATFTAPVSKPPY